MKKFMCLGLSVVLALGMTACGSKPEEPKAPTFSEEELTEAQQYVYAAMDSYEIPDRGDDFKAARVMLTDDLVKDFVGKVDIKTWDVSEVDAVVVAYLGDKVEEGSTESQTEDDWNPVVFLMGGEDKKVIYVNVEDTLAAGEVPVSEDVVASDEDAITEAKKALAQAQLDAEAYLEENKEKLADYLELFASKIEENSEYVYSFDYFADISEGNSYQGFYAGHFRNIYRAEYRLNQLTAENPKAEDLIAEDYLLFDDKFELLKNMYNTQQTIADLEATGSSQLEEYKAVLETEKANEDYLFNESYVRAALANETANSYDNAIRQMKVYETSLETLEKVMASSNKSERTYMTERAELMNNYLADYSNMYKTYVQCLVNLSNFEMENAEAIAAYDAEVETIKETIGEGYEDSVEYIKAQLKYEEVLTSYEAFKNAIPLAKADLDAMKEEYEAGILALDTEEKERLDSLVIIQEKDAFFEYVCNATADVTEYDAQKGQWGSIHPDYAAYQNQHLDYYTSYSGGSSSGKSSYSGSSSSSGKGAGGYDMPNEGEEFSDYIKRVDPDLYDTITDIYNDATAEYR